MEQNAQKEREKILEIKNLCMEFPAGKKKTVKALNNVTFDIYKGENFGLVGERLRKDHPGPYSDPPLQSNLR